VQREGGATASLSRCRRYVVLKLTLPFASRHHQSVDVASRADVIATTLKGSAGSIVNRAPETPAPTANDAVFAVV
jgi:hypothetical protein